MGCMEGNGWETFRRALTHRGLRSTKGRLTVLEAMRHLPRHLSADELYSMLRRQGCRVSRATVYRTLATLEQAGLVRQVRLNSGPARYELVQQDEPASAHAHFVCRRCGVIVDLPVEMEFFASLAERLPVDLVVTEVRLVGLCRRCMNALKDKVPSNSALHIASRGAAQDCESYASAAAGSVAGDVAAQPQEGGE